MEVIHEVNLGGTSDLDEDPTNPVGAPDAAADDENDDAEALAESGALEMAATADVDLGAMPAPTDHTQTPQSLAASATVSDLGYVSSPDPRFNDVPNIGRITTWPAKMPLERRSVSCRCYMHPNCTSPAKRRWAVGDDILLQWLFSGQCDPNASRERKEKLGEEHRAKWRTLYDGAASSSTGGRGKGSSSSTAA